MHDVLVSLLASGERNCGYHGNGTSIIRFDLINYLLVCFGVIFVGALPLVSCHEELYQ